MKFCATSEKIVTHKIVFCSLLKYLRKTAINYVKRIITISGSSGHAQQMLECRGGLREAFKKF